MFARSAAPDTPQGQAICQVNSKWGEDTLQRAGRETLGFPVCKKKYAPFVFPIRRRVNPDGSPGLYEVRVERLYGCKCHHPLRQRVIERYGERPGWEPFGQWSLKKAHEQAKHEAKRLNRDIVAVAPSPLAAAAAAVATPAVAVSSSSSDSSSDVDDDDSDEEGNSSEAGMARNMCLSGKCLWKVRTAYDNVFKELTGYTESEAEDNGG